MIALLDYGMGNLLSVSKALAFAGAEVQTVDNGKELDKFAAVVLPGVGNFGDGMENLHSRNLAGPVKKFIKSGKPFLGICLGMQMLMDDSEEAPGVKGLGVFSGKVIRFPEMGLKVPHMGWNNVISENKTPYMDEISDNSYFYFVHSYYVKPDDNSVTALSCEYGIKFTAAIGHGKIFATQFHPEKSQNNGISILKNFVKISGKAK